MTQKVIYTAIILFSGFSSSDAFAQSLQGKPGQTLPKQLYIEKYLSANPLLAETKEKIGSSELFDFYKLPLDNMISAAPVNGFKLHIKVYDPTIGAEYLSVDIPNALSKGMLVK